VNGVFPRVLTAWGVRAHGCRTEAQRIRADRPANQADGLIMLTGVFGVELRITLTTGLLNYSSRQRRA